MTRIAKNPMDPAEKNISVPTDQGAPSVEQANWTFSPAEVSDQDMSAVRDVLAQSSQPDPGEPAMPLVTLEQIVEVLRASYAVGGLWYGYPDLWSPDPAELMGLAVALLPKVQTLCEAFPAAAVAIGVVDTSSVYVRLVWFWGRPIWLSEVRKRKEKREEEFVDAGSPSRPDARRTEVSAVQQPARRETEPGPERFIVP